MKPMKQTEQTQQQQQQKPAQDAPEAPAPKNPDLRDLVIPVSAADVAEIRDFAGVTRRLVAIRPIDHMFFQNNTVEGAATTKVIITRGTVFGWRTAEVGVIGKVTARGIQSWANKTKTGTIPLPARVAEALSPEELIALPDGTVNSKGELRVSYFPGKAAVDGKPGAEPCVQVEVTGHRFGAAASGIGFWIHPATVYAAAAMLDAHPDAHTVQVTIWWHHSGPSATTNGIVIKVPVADNTAALADTLALR